MLECYTVAITLRCRIGLARIAFHGVEQVRVLVITKVDADVLELCAIP